MNDRVAQHLEGFPVTVACPVSWGDMDAFEHVNNVVFFRFFENARIEYLRRIELADRDRRDGIGPILHSTNARFRVPLRYPDAAWAGARVTEVLEDRLVMEYRVVSDTHGAVAADGGGIVVTFDYRQRRKVPVPEDVRRAIAGLERD
jgi:acyl-CoA thioester hydrolase